MTIAGRILDPWSVPLHGARVRVVYLDRKNQVYMDPVLADVRGRFELRDLDEGVIELQADHPDHLAERLALGELRKGDVRRNLELRLGVARTVAGTVFWPDHTPARWVLVEAFDTSERHGRQSLSVLPEPWRTLTDEEGRFEIGGLGTQPIQLKASALAEGEPVVGVPSERFNAWLRYVVPGQGSVVLVLEEGARIRGRVVDEFGVPWASGNIFVREVGSSDWPSRHDFPFQNGSFDIRKLHAGAYEIAASGGAAGAGPSLTVEAPGVAEDLELIAPRGAQLAGTVFADGSPVANAEVILRFLLDRGLPTLQDYSRTQSPWRARTDEHGHFHLEQVRSGTHLLSARHATLGRTTFEVAIVSGNEPEDLVIELEPTGRIEGRLAGEVRPAADRRVGIYNRDHSEHVRVRTDAEGRFSAEHLIPGQYVVGLAADGQSEGPVYGRGEAIVVAEVLPGQTTSLVLGGMDRAVRIDGRVVCNEVPQPGIEVWGLLRDLVGDQDLVIGRVTDERGRFVLDLPQGGYFTLFFGPWGAGPCADLFFPDGAVVERTFELPAGTIAGRVLDRAGSPAGGARVRIEGDADFPPRATTADDEGSFSFQYVEPGHYVLSGGGHTWGERPTAAPYGYDRSLPFELTAGQSLEGLSLTLPPAASLRGRVLPRPGGGRLEEVEYVTATPLKYGGESSYAEYAVIEGDHYTFTSMGLGEYRIDVVACCEHGGSLSRNVTVTEGADVVLDLQIE